mmetsp:Transcript_16779/g.19161  ORF Transcript_16779/g.19161 Transcript_16779/m.19161 type:complete len:136 (+) Transcript_16779:564-971(+)
MPSPHIYFESPSSSSFVFDALESMLEKVTLMLKNIYTAITTMSFNMPALFPKNIQRTNGWKGTTRVIGIGGRHSTTTHPHSRYVSRADSHFPATQSTAGLAGTVRVCARDIKREVDWCCLYSIPFHPTTVVWWNG